MSYVQFVNKQKDIETAHMVNETGTKRSAQIWRQFKKNKGAVLGLIVLCCFIIIAIASSFIWDFKTDICGMHTKTYICRNDKRSQI